MNEWPNFEGETVDLAGNHFKWADLVTRAIRNAPLKPGVTRWCQVSEMFAVGSTVAAAICVEFGLDPWEVGKRAKK